MKSMLRVFLLVASFLALASAVAMAQTKPAGTIRGTVTNSAGKAVSGARVTVNSKKSNADKSTVTGKMGHFSFQNLSAGYYTLKVSDAGYKPKVQPMIMVMKGKTTEDRVTLKKKSGM